MGYIFKMERETKNQKGDKMDSATIDKNFANTEREIRAGNIVAFRRRGYAWLEDGTDNMPVTKGDTMLVVRVIEDWNSTYNRYVDTHAILTLTGDDRYAVDIERLIFNAPY